MFIKTRFHYHLQLLLDVICDKWLPHCISCVNKLLRKSNVDTAHITFLAICLSQDLVIITSFYSISMSLHALIYKKSKRKVQGMQQSQTAVLQRHKEEEEIDKTKPAQIGKSYHLISNYTKTDIIFIHPTWNVPNVVFESHRQKTYAFVQSDHNLHWPHFG